MGFFDVVGSVLSAPFAVTDGIIKGVGAASGSNNAPPVNVPNVTAPSIDSRYSGLQNSQIKSANDYNPDQTESDYANQNQENSRRTLAQSMAGVKSNYNSRGMLYSGSRIGDENKAASDAATTGAQNQQGFNQTTYNNANTLNNNAISTGFGMAGLGTNSYLGNEAAQNSAMQQALYQQQMNNAGIGALGKGVGSVLGSATARSMSNTGGGLL